MSQRDATGHAQVAAGGASSATSTVTESRTAGSAVLALIQRR
jgi:hypothetical protein